MILVST